MTDVVEMFGKGECSVGGFDTRNVNCPNCNFLLRKAKGLLHSAEGYTCPKCGKQQKDVVIKLFHLKEESK